MAREESDSTSHHNCGTLSMNSSRFRSNALEILCIFFSHASFPARLPIPWTSRKYLLAGTQVKPHFSVLLGFFKSRCSEEVSMSWYVRWHNDLTIPFHPIFIRVGGEGEGRRGRERSRLLPCHTKKKGTKKRCPVHISITHILCSVSHVSYPNRQPPPLTIHSPHA